MSVKLNITTDNSNILIDKTEPQMEISGQQAQMTLEKQEGNFKIHQKADTLEINSYNAFKQLNSYRPQDLMVKMKQKAEQETSKGISRYVTDGEAMMKIENKGNPIAKIAEDHGYINSNTSLNIEHFPKEPVEINVKEGYFQVESNPDVITPVVQKNLNIQVEPGGVYTTVDKIPKVNIEVVGEILDSKA
ncbi:MAG: hypothetical protein JXM74_01385 [Fusobacteriaceae bacterium]|nr:hypothetical protein [Fusobacteriaceae bacterium]MBN2837389.1 hypothetical protein [Fusobacteriaceae bacterium]